MKNKILSQISSQWEKLPEEIQQSLNHTIFLSKKYLSSSNEKVQQRFIGIMVQYGELLGGFIHSSGIGQIKDQPDMKPRINMLKNIPFFQGLSDYDLIMVAEQMEDITVEPGTDILTQGEATDGVYFVKEGSVEIFIDKEIVAHRKAGSSFGEMSCLRGEANASATVRTVIRSQILRIPRDKFMQFVNKSTQLWNKVFADTTNRFKESSQRLSEVLQHTPQGIVKINQEGKLTNEFSAQCKKYFGTQQLEGLLFHELILPHNVVAQENWKQTFPMLFEDSVITFDSLTDMLPKEVTFPDQNGFNREFLLHYYPCRTQDQKINAIDIGMEDITEERELTRHTAALEKEKNILQKMYDDPEAFFSMLNLGAGTLPHLFKAAEILQSNLSTSQGLLQVMPEKEKEFLPELMRQLHTLKGISGMFLLDGLQQVSHDLEDCLRWIQTNETITSYHINMIQEKTQEMEQQCNQTNAFVLENMSEGLQSRMMGIVFSQKEFAKLKEAAFQEDLTAIQQLIRNVEKIPIKKLVKRWPNEIELLGKKLGKRAQLQVEGDDFNISKELYSKLDAPLIHLLRNCLDHGLETPEARIKLGKPEEGTITVSVQQDQEIILTISDDGQGLNVPKIIEKAKENFLLDQQEIESHISANQAWKILLMPGFSTVDQITDVSGRGIGLDAVQATISELQGSISITTEPNKGSTFSLILPLESST